jgi:hypothetical protein
MKYAGEGWFSTEEYAKPSDIDNPHTRAEVGREGEYYPTKNQGDAVYRRRRKK